MKTVHNTFFVPPAPLNIVQAQTFATSFTSKRHTCAQLSQKHNYNYAHMSTKPTNSGKGNDKQDDSNKFDGDAAPFGRFREFTSSTGNLNTQDDLVREVLWQATCLSTSESIESTIESHIDAASEVLSEMYSRSERDIEERNQRLAIQTSLPDISKWNKHLMNSTKASKQNRMEISKELAIVDALLKRATRSKRGTYRRRRRFRQRQDTSSVQTKNNNINVVGAIIDSDFLSTAVSTPKGLMFTTAVCTVALESFDTITSQEGGTQRLVDYAGVSTFFIIMIAYLSAVRAAMHKAREELDRHSGRGPSNRL